MVLCESQQANLLSNSDSSLLLQVKRTLVVVAVILCAVVTPCESQNYQLGCGKQQEKLISTRIVRGEDAELGEFPWHAAIFSSAYSKPKYICGGSIIHKRAVISSAHCLVSHNRMVHKNLITVHVGRVDLNETTEHQQVLNVSKLIVHPNFFPLIGLTNDIAILKLSTDIVMSSSVYPVCLWHMADGPSKLNGKSGTIVGFGLNENDTVSTVLQKAELTVVDIYDCLDNDRAAYGPVLTRNMYCAGGKANVSACNGDSGGGMFFEENGIWYIRGIISFIAMRPDAALCDSSKYTIFTDMSGYKDWVKKSISEPLAPKGLSHVPPCKSKSVPKDGTCNVAHFFDHNFLLVGAHSKIMRVSLNGEQNFSLSTETFGLDHDCAEGRFYSSNPTTKKIFSANYNGTDQKIFIEEDIPKVADMAVDWISRRLYWTDIYKDTIEVASLVDPNVRTVLINENIVVSKIVVDPYRSKLYWINSFDKETIEWSNLDGTNRQVLVTFNETSFVNNMKVSIGTGELCYCDRDMARIHCIDPLSNGIRTIVSNIDNLEELSVTDELVFWTDYGLNSPIESINKNGERQEPITMLDFGYTSGMTAVSDKCPLFYSPCAINNGDCPENTICLVNPDAPAGRSCIVKQNVSFPADVPK